MAFKKILFFLLLYSQQQNALDIYRLVVFISNATNEFYDARIESGFKLNAYLKNLIDKLNTPIQSGNNKVALLDNINEKNVIDYDNLFVFYLQNSYLEIPSLDMLKISTWLNNNWSKFLNSK